MSDAIDTPREAAEDLRLSLVAVGWNEEAAQVRALLAERDAAVERAERAEAGRARRERRERQERDAARRLRERLAAAQRDVERLDYWERHPGACLNRLQVWWTTAGAGFRENYQNVRAIIDEVREEHGDPIDAAMQEGSDAD